VFDMETDRGRRRARTITSDKQLTRKYLSVKRDWLCADVESIDHETAEEGCEDSGGCEKDTSISPSCGAVKPMCCFLTSEMTPHAVWQTFFNATTHRNEGAVDRFRRTR